MTVVMRAPDKSILVLTKGADSIIFQLLQTGQDDQTSRLNTDLEIYSEDGLRTLCYAMRTISEDHYQEWAQKYSAASLCITDRDAELEKVAIQLEKDLILVGATAIEDKLQDGVPEAIDCLLAAGIKIWVLTGDKTETAINIGYSCNVLPKDCTLLIIRGATAENDGGSTMQQLEAALKVIQDSHSNGIDEIFSLVIDGNALIYALEKDDIRLILLELTKNCIAVMCCRVSPKQKAKVVCLVRDSESAVTLAIGDGANDVSMIQAAHVKSK
jgi:magnesium-transporting ATPase (P-type)